MRSYTLLFLLVLLEVLVQSAATNRILLLATSSGGRDQWFTFLTKDLFWRDGEAELASKKYENVDFSVFKKRYDSYVRTKFLRPGAAMEKALKVVAPEMFAQPTARSVSTMASGSIPATTNSIPDPKTTNSFNTGPSCGGRRALSGANPDCRFVANCVTKEHYRPQWECTDATGRNNDLIHISQCQTWCDAQDTARCCSWDKTNNICQFSNQEAMQHVDGSAHAACNRNTECSSVGITFDSASGPTIQQDPTHIKDHLAQLLHVQPYQVSLFTVDARYNFMFKVAARQSDAAALEGYFGTRANRIPATNMEAALEQQAVNQYPAIAAATATITEFKNRNHKWRNSQCGCTEFVSLQVGVTTYANIKIGRHPALANAAWVQYQTDVQNDFTTLHGYNLGRELITNMNNACDNPGKDYWRHCIVVFMKPGQTGNKNYPMGACNSEIKRGDHSESCLQYNPHSPVPYGPDRAEWISLTHEFIHAYYVVKGGQGWCDSTYRSCEEYATVGLCPLTDSRKFSENRFRALSNTPLRLEYGGQDVVSRAFCFGPTANGQVFDNWENDFYTNGDGANANWYTLGGNPDPNTKALVVSDPYYDLGGCTAINDLYGPNVVGSIEKLMIPVDFDVRAFLATVDDEVTRCAGMASLLASNYQTWKWGAWVYKEANRVVGWAFTQLIPHRGHAVTYYAHIDYLCASRDNIRSTLIARIKNWYQVNANNHPAGARPVGVTANMLWLDYTIFENAQFEVSNPLAVENLGTRYADNFYGHHLLLMKWDFGQVANPANQQTKIAVTYNRNKRNVHNYNQRRQNGRIVMRGAHNVLYLALAENDGVKRCCEIQYPSCARHNNDNTVRCTNVSWCSDGADIEYVTVFAVNVRVLMGLP